jgi:hypothetical protein
LADIKIHRVSEHQYRRAPDKVVADVATLLARRAVLPG